MRGIIAVVVLSVAVVGCGKKKVAEAGPDSSPPPLPPAPVQPNPSPTPAGGGSGGPAVVPGGGVGVVVNPGAALGGGGSGGAVQAVRKAARRASALNDLKNLGELIESMRDPFGKMPTKDQILAEVKRTMPKVHEAITEGAYVLTGTTEGGGLWAYEVDADKTPGIAVIGGRATRSTPDDLRPYFRGNTPGALENTPVPPTPAAPPKPVVQFASVTMKDMDDVRLYIDTASGASGRMPPPQQVHAALVQAGSPAAKLVETGAIMLTGAKSRDSIWAYEAKTAFQGGMVAGPGGVETMTAAQLRQRLGR